jgi:thioesterase domain-containing protein
VLVEGQEKPDAPQLLPDVAFVTSAHALSIGAWRADELRPPLFLVPGAGSSGRRAFAALSLALGDEWPVCVLADPSSGCAPYSIEDLARRFVQRIVETQPAGPYVVGGYCFGGVVAYEIALQLLAAGRSVRLLALIDTPRPGYPQFLRHAHLFAAGSVFHLARALRQADHGEQFRQAAAALLRHIRRRARGAAERIAPTVGTGSNIRAMRMYRPKPLHVPALVVISREHGLMGSPLDRRLGWLRCIRPRPTLATLEGHHTTVLKHQAGDLARHIALALDAGATSSSSS